MTKECLGTHAGTKKMCMEQITVVKRGAPVRQGVVRFSVGRASSGKGKGCRAAHALGNPFGIKPHGPYTREESLAKYEVWLEEKVAAKDPAVCGALNAIWSAAKQGPVELECFCSPLGCHGDTVKRLVKERL